MNINVSLVDQRLEGLKEEIRASILDNFNIKEEGRLKSIAFVYLCVKALLDLEIDEAIECLTEGGGDFGVDAIHFTEEIDEEFYVTLFQGKYKTKLEGNSHFEEKAIEGLINAVRYIFNPSAVLGNINERLQVKVEAIRSLIRDGIFPRVRIIACNNGLRWNDFAQAAIDRENFGDRVTWEHVNHDVLVKIFQSTKAVDASLRFTGKAIIEDMNFSRVCIGRIPVFEIANLMKMHGEKLLERNIRRYLGLHGNRVNLGIKENLNNNPSNFYFFNNGLTLVCSDFTYNGLQDSNYQVKIENLQIVNGAQTCMTILKTFEESSEELKNSMNEASVLVRLYKLPKNADDIIVQITHATNSQNPVDLKDLKSNNDKQVQLEIAIHDLGFTYRRKRIDSSTKLTDITSGVAAEAVLAVWRGSPQQAKFLTREHFGKLYNSIFTEDLNATQVIIAFLLYRIAERHRRRPTETDPSLVRYASSFIGMQMGRRLLNDLKLELKDFDHRNFEKSKKLVEDNGEEYFNQSVKDVEFALSNLYNGVVSLQQLSATFRRGDLIETIKNIKL